MNKKVTKLFLLLMALFAPSVGWAQDETVTTQGMTFTWDTNYYVLTSFDAAAYAGNDEATIGLYLPETIGELTGNGENYDIGGIGENAFSDVTQLSAISLPAILSRIDANAFKGCTNLGEVFFNGPLSNVAIADNAFDGVGTADEPMKVTCNGDYPGDFFKYITGLVEWTDGVADWKGAKIWTHESINGCFTNGYMVDYLLTVVMSVKKASGTKLLAQGNLQEMIFPIGLMATMSSPLMRTCIYTGLETGLETYL